MKTAIINITTRANRRSSLLVLLFSLLFVGCEQESDLIGGHTEELQFTMSIAPLTRVQTDAAYKTTWEDGDKIGLFAVCHNPEESVELAATDNYLHNVALTNHATTQKWSSETPIYIPTGNKELDFYAYYPYDDSYTNPTDMELITYNDQNIRVGANASPIFNACDIMFARPIKDVSGSTPSVALTFVHQMAMVEVRIDGNYAKMGSVSACLEGCVPTAKGNLSSGVTVTGSDRQEVVMFNWGAKYGDPTATSFTFRALVPAQEISAATNLFRISAGDNQFYSAALPKAKTLVAGTIETYYINPYSYAIGDYYPNSINPVGVVFYVENPVEGRGPHGKIIGLKEDSKAWGPQGINTSANDNNGLVNMETIRKLNNDFGDYPAFKWAHELNNPTPTTYSAADKGIWYLPAKIELRQLFAGMCGYHWVALGATAADEIDDWGDTPFLVNIDATLRNAFNKKITDAGGTIITLSSSDDPHYLSSNESYSPSIAVLINMFGGYRNDGLKDNLYRVRAIMAF